MERGKFCTKCGEKLPEGFFMIYDPSAEPKKVKMPKADNSAQQLSEKTYYEPTNDLKERNFRQTKLIDSILEDRKLDANKSSDLEFAMALAEIQQPKLFAPIPADGTNGRPVQQTKVYAESGGLTRSEMQQAAIEKAAADNGIDLASGGSKSLDLAFSLAYEKDPALFKAGD